MPRVYLVKLIVEKDSDTESYKHLLDHENFDVYSVKEDETMFTMVQKVSRGNGAVKEKTT